MIDNVLRGGRVAEPDPDDEGDRVLVELNERIITDERVDVAMVAVSDGITLVLKR
jgi:predicted O-methyltransferase YrrM